MLLARPQPNEFSPGYVGRLRVLNRLSDRNATVAALHAHHLQSGTITPAPDRSRPEAKLLALTAELSLPQYLREHTLIPFTRGFSPAGQVTRRHAEEYTSKRCPANQLAPARAGAAFCSACAHVQLDALGYSYWRRDCQVPGVDVCPVHGIPLHITNRPNAFALPPLAFADEALECAAYDTEAPGVQFYLSTAMLLLSRESPVSSTFLRTARRRYAAGTAERPAGVTIEPWEEASSLLAVPQTWTARHREDLGFFSAFSVKHDDSLFEEIGAGWKILLLSLVCTSFEELRNRVRKLRPGRRHLPW